MKLLRYLFFFLTPGVIISACQKQSSIENIVSQASGSLLKTTSGDCAAVTMGGTYVQNSTLGTSNYMDVQVNFTVIGNYEIKSDTVNGYAFKATGQATLPGVQTVRLFSDWYTAFSGNRCVSHQLQQQCMPGECGGKHFISCIYIRNYGRYMYGSNGCR